MTLSLRLVSALALWSAACRAQDVVAVKHDVYCLTLHEDLMRRQADEWGSMGPFTVTDGTKHTPFTKFEISTRKATVIVGNGDDVGGVYHPMIASDNPTTVHFIQFLYAVDQFGQLIAVETMDPNMPAPATVVLDVPEYVTEVTAYEFCNLHGLWKGPTVSTAVEGVLTGTNSSDTQVGKAADAAAVDMSLCGIDSPLSVAYDSFAADFVRRQSLPPFNQLDPYNEEDGAKHTPYIHLNDNGTATVVVGVEGNYHVMKGGSRELDENGDKVEPHWITDVYVVDQTGEILTMQSLNPTHIDVAQIIVTIPSSATTLTAYEWCNIHGLYVGPTVNAKTGEIMAVEPPTEAPLVSAARRSTLAATGIMAAALLV